MKHTVCGRNKVFSVGMIVFLMSFIIGCGSGGWGDPSASKPLTVFVTSVSGTGDLNSWPDANGLEGLAAGDAICQARADDAGLSGTYKAWLSTDTTDAYCHIQGYDGTIAGNCGQGTLPVNAGPWIRTDGFPFARTIDHLINDHEVYAPVRYDENGNVVDGSISRYIHTGTKLDGTASTQHCTNWTSPITGGTLLGDVNGASSSWTEQAGGNCGATNRLLCFQTGAGGPLPAIAPPASAKKVFVTSTTGTGALHSWVDAGIESGLAAGDAICQARATAASLTGTYKAWLSDSTTDAKDRITTDGPWYRIDGVKVADNKAALLAALSTDTATPFFTAISQMETGAYIDIPYYEVWTGTSADGVKTGSTCSNWSDSTASGYNGFASISNSQWTSFTTRTCSQSKALYCFED